MRLDYPRGSHDIRTNAYLFDPRSLSDLDRLRDRDRQALYDLKQLEAAIETIKAYRLDLMERAQYLAAETATLSIELHRRKQYQGNVTYTLELVRTYPDNTRRTESRKTYAGRDRHKAIADYNAALKSHPGAPCVLDIERGRWER